MSRIDLEIAVWQATPEDQRGYLHGGMAVKRLDRCSYEVVLFPMSCLSVRELRNYLRTVKKLQAA